MKRFKTILFLSVFLSVAHISYAQIPDNAEDIAPLLYGEDIPEATLTDLDGNKQSLSGIIGNKPTILVFYRGGWCPYCNAQLSGVQEIETDIEALGYQVIAISPDGYKQLNESIDKQSLKYSLYSDADGSLTKAIGIAFKAPEKYGNMLLKHSDGQNDGFLPVPSVFVVNKDRTILFEYINPDYKTRLSSNLLMAVLKAL